MKACGPFALRIWLRGEGIDDGGRASFGLPGKMTEKTFKTIQNVTVYITVIWYNNHAKGKKVPDAKY